MVPLKGLFGAVRRKALQEMAATVAEDFKDAPVRLSILHSVAPALAEEQREALDAAGARYTIAGVVTVGAVIGTYAGPGAVGIAYYPES
ncbi:MAG: DegV family protein [Coriobacteriia bacterium]